VIHLRLSTVYKQPASKFIQAQIVERLWDVEGDVEILFDVLGGIIGNLLYWRDMVRWIDGSRNAVSCH